MNILVLNCGSSSVKFQLITTDQKSIDTDCDRCIARGLVERIGDHALSTFKAGDRPHTLGDHPIRDYRQAINEIMRWIISKDSGIEEIRTLGDIHAVGHRVVHGGEFATSTLINDKAISALESCIDLAPLHNPANLKGIRAAQEIFGPNVPQVGVFDTAFHATMPEVSYLYGIPYNLSRRYKIRRYGFHGTSHRYIAYRYHHMRQLPMEAVNIITLHLGNGCSACAIKNGASYDTTMGFTPLEGLLMGTRSGDINPSIIDYLSHKEGMSLPVIFSLLNKQSGLLGISGIANDMRELLKEEAEHGNRQAKLAINIFCQRVRKYIGAYFAEMGGAEAVVFTGGIGENSPEVRGRICEGLECLGLHLDKKENGALQRGQAGEISTPPSKLKAYVIPTNEELLIAWDTFRVVTGTLNETASST